MTGFDEHGVPQGVAVIHVGGSDLVRGLVETACRWSRPTSRSADTRPIAFPPTAISLWMVKTERLLVLSQSRDEVAGVVGRLKAASGRQLEGCRVVSRDGRGSRAKPAVRVGRFAAGGADGRRRHGQARCIRRR